jgi:tyrosinase
VDKILTRTHKRRFFRPIEISFVLLLLLLCAGQHTARALPERETLMQRPKQKPPAVPEMVGATRAPFFIGPGVGPTEVIIPLHDPAGPVAAKVAAGAQEIHVVFENLTSDEPSPTYRVFLDRQVGGVAEAPVELFIGNLGMFGIVDSSDPRGEQGGQGQTFRLTATRAFAYLRANHRWDPQELHITLFRASWEGSAPRVRVGRVSVYFQ